MRIAISGAQGFAGRHLAETAVARGYDVECLTRTEPAAPVKGARYVNVSDRREGADYSKWQGGADVFVHLAGRAHVMRETSNDPVLAFHAINVESTMMAANRAKALGVKRFVFISSIGVHGNTSDEPVRADSVLNPQAMYAESKLAAENALQAFQAGSEFEVVTVRPPLMYGPNVGANFLRLIRLIDSGLPLPFASIDNRRSFLGVQNFTDFTLHVACHPECKGKAFVPADCEVVSTPKLVKMISRLLGRKARLFSIPQGLLLAGSRLSGKQALYNQLCGSLSVDIDYLRQTSGWRPPFSQEKLLGMTVDWYLSHRR